MHKFALKTALIISMLQIKFLFYLLPHCNGILVNYVTFFFTSFTFLAKAYHSQLLLFIISLENITQTSAKGSLHKNTKITAPYHYKPPSEHAKLAYHVCVYRITGAICSKVIGVIRVIQLYQFLTSPD